MVNRDTEKGCSSYRYEQCHRELVAKPRSRRLVFEANLNFGAPVEVSSNWELTDPKPYAHERHDTGSRS